MMSAHVVVRASIAESGNALAAHRDGAAAIGDSVFAAYRHRLPGDEGGRPGSPPADALNAGADLLIFSHDVDLALAAAADNRSGRR